MKFRIDYINDKVKRYLPLLVWSKTIYQLYGKFYDKDFDNFPFLIKDHNDKDIVLRNFGKGLETGWHISHIISQENKGKIVYLI